MTFIKSMLFILLMAYPYAVGAMDDYRNSPALPTYAKYLNYTPRERFEGMLAEAIKTLREEILAENGVSTEDIISCKPNCMPETVQGNELRAALEIVIKHYAHLRRIQDILSTVLSNEISLTDRSIVPHSWGKDRLDVSSSVQKPGASFWKATYIAKKESEAAIAKSETELKKTVFYVELPKHKCLTSYNTTHYFYLDALPDKDLFEIPVVGPFSLHQIEKALEFLSSYVHPDLPVVSNFNISAGAELKSALDTILDAKARKGQGSQIMHTMPYLGQFDSYKMQALIHEKTVEALNDELLESNITNEARQALDAQMRIERAKYKAIKKAIESKEDEGARLESHILQAQTFEQQAMGTSNSKQIISKLKEAYNLFDSAFSAGEQDRVLYNLKRFNTG